MKKVFQITILLSLLMVGLSTAHAVKLVSEGERTDLTGYRLVQPYELYGYGAHDAIFGGWFSNKVQLSSNTMQRLYSEVIQTVEKLGVVKDGKLTKAGAAKLFGTTSAILFGKEIAEALAETVVLNYNQSRYAHFYGKLAMHLEMYPHLYDIGDTACANLFNYPEGYQGPINIYLQDCIKTYWTTFFDGYVQTARSCAVFPGFHATVNGFQAIRLAIKRLKVQPPLTVSFVSWQYNYDYPAYWSCGMYLVYLESLIPFRMYVTRTPQFEYFSWPTPDWIRAGNG